MIDNDTIKKAFYDWVFNFTAVPVVWANQNAPQPVRPYIVLNLQTGLPIGHDFYSKVDPDSGLASLGGILQVTLAIEAYCKNSFFVLEELSRSVYIEEPSYTLREAGITFLNRLAINDLTGLDDTMFEDRSRMDMAFLIGSQIDNINVGIIQRVEGTATYKKEDEIVKEEEFAIGEPYGD